VGFVNGWVENVKDQERRDMDTDNTQDTPEPSLASAGSVGEVLAKGISDIIRIAAEPDWISVTERLPEPCEQVLCYAITEWTPGWEPQIVVTSHNGHGYWDCDSMTVTHWRPLPAPPSDGK
jgi:hypothetical protein